MPLESSVQGVARAGKGRDDGDRHDRSPHDERATPALAGVGWEEVDPPIERMGDGQGQDERDDSPRDSSPGSATRRRRMAEAATATSAQPVSHSMIPSRALAPLRRARAASATAPIARITTTAASRHRLRARKEVGAAATASLAASSRT